MPAFLIRAFIARMEPTRIFTTRELLHLSNRGTVDMTLHKMVKMEHIQRLARGVFVKDLAYKPSAIEVARVKALAWGKTLVVHADKLLAARGLVPLSPDSKFNMDCRSGNYSLQKCIVQVHEICARKKKLAENRVGDVMRSIWHLRKENCTAKSVQSMVIDFNRTDREQYKDVVKWLPSWLTDYFFYLRTGVIKSEQDGDSYFAKFNSKLKFG